MTRYGFTCVTLCAAALVACGDSKNVESTTRSGDSASAAGSLEGPSQRMMDSTSMPGMDRMMGSRTIDSMQIHMRGMEAMSADRMKAMIPAHRRMVANMLTTFDDSMRSMNMPSDKAWSALRDSISQDLIRMPELSASQLKTSVAPHHARVMRLMTMHEAMMSGMKR